MEWFCLNVKFRVLWLLIFHISQMSNLSFISSNFARDFLFRSGLQPLPSNFDLKKILKSPAKIINFFEWYLHFLRLWSSSKIFTSSVSVLPLYIFIWTYWSASSVISRIKILPTLSVFCLLTLLKTKEFLPR